jgi:hypothetical protein
MYRVGNRITHHRKRTVWTIALLLVLIGGLITTGSTLKKRLLPHTHITNSATVVKQVTIAKAAAQTFDEGVFTISLPTSWKAVAGEKQPYDLYRFEGDIGTPNEQVLEIYQDTIPVNFAVNEVLPVSSAGAQLAPLGTISDNCDTFTKSTAAIATSAGTPAKWSGINFLCDLNNTERSVIGTSSPDGVNTVTLDGPTSGKHSFFFDYSDTSISPDYTTLYNALASFRVK